jgi:hypothetical protein
VRAALVVALCACHAQHVETCADDLSGAWVGSDGRRWIVNDNLEVYPGFSDSPAPRVIDLVREGAGLSGTLQKRYEQRTEQCVAHLPVRVTACKDDALELVITEPAPPLSFAECTWPSLASHVERWRKE